MKNRPGIDIDTDELQPLLKLRHDNRASRENDVVIEFNAYQDDAHHVIPSLNDGSFHIVSHDVVKLIAAMLDLQSMAQLAQTNRSLHKLTESAYPLNDDTIEHDALLKRARILGSAGKNYAYIREVLNGVSQKKMRLNKIENDVIESRLCCNGQHRSLLLPILLGVGSGASIAVTLSVIFIFIPFPMKIFPIIEAIVPPSAGALVASAGFFTGVYLKNRKDRLQQEKLDLEEDVNKLLSVPDPA